MGGNAWVTLATNDTYGLGALVLAHSLRQVGTVNEIAILITPTVTSAMKQRLANIFDVVKTVNILDSRDEVNLRLLKRPELGITFTKIHCWQFIQYDNCVFLDADTLVLDNVDELFEREELSAAPDVGWPDCFNSGVFVFKPSTDTFTRLVEFAIEKGSFDGGDQGLLNLYFSNWAQGDIRKHLPFIYNMCSTACYSYLPAFQRFGANAKIVHFIGNTKPWLQYFDMETREVNVSHELLYLKPILQKWWNIFCFLVHPTLLTDMAPSRAMCSEPTPSIVNHTFMLQMHSNQADIPVESKVEDSDFRNVWDPWDSYEIKEIQLVEHIPLAQLHVTKSMERTTTHLCNNIIYGKKCDVQANNTPISSYTGSPLQTCEGFNLSGVHYEDYSNNCFSQISNVHVAHAKQPLLINDVDQNSNLLNNFHNPSKQSQYTQASQIPAISINRKTAFYSNINEIDTHDTGGFAQLQLGIPQTSAQNVLEDDFRRQCWETGNIDYMGRDSFDHIWSKICKTVNQRSHVQLEFSTGLSSLEVDGSPGEKSINIQSIEETDYGNNNHQLKPEKKKLSIKVSVQLI